MLASFYQVFIGKLSVFQDFSYLNQGFGYANIFLLCTLQVLTKFST